MSNRSAWIAEEMSQLQQIQHSNNHSIASHQPLHSLNIGIGSLLFDLLAPSINKIQINRNYF